MQLEIRPADCDSFGHVNNAVYLSYFEQALAACLVTQGNQQDWQSGSECHWQARSLSLEYRQPVAYGDRLEGRLWLATPNRSQPTFGFEIQTRPAGPGEAKARTACRAAGVWRRKNGQSGEPEQIPEALLGRFPVIQESYHAISSHPKSGSITGSSRLSSVRWVPTNLSTSKHATSGWKRISSMPRPSLAGRKNAGLRPGSSHCRHVTIPRSMPSPS